MTFNIHKRIAELEAVEGIQDKIDNLEYDPEALELVDLRAQVEEGIPFYSVSIHLYDRAYGGPEEGGWWFDYGEPDHGYWNFTRLFDNQDDARAYANTLDGVIAELNQGRPEVSSMASEGRYGWFIQEGYPHAWPVTRPHYE